MGPALVTSRWPRLHDIDFFVYSRAASSAADLETDAALDEEHWSYMDRFAHGMTARGPTLAADRATWTGSLHIVDLPDVDAVCAFVEHEPYNRACLFEDHFIRRFKNLLGRTMWESLQESAEPRFLVIAHLREGGKHALPGSPANFTALPPDRLIVQGELLTLHQAKPAGVALALQAPTRNAVADLLRDGPAGLDEIFDLEILDWEFGGRR
jgi:uncharacterized protein YciI